MVRSYPVHARRTGWRPTAVAALACILPLALLRLTGEEWTWRIGDGMTDGRVPRPFDFRPGVRPHGGVLVPDVRRRDHAVRPLDALFWGTRRQTWVCCTPCGGSCSRSCTAFLLFAAVLASGFAMRAVVGDHSPPPLAMSIGFSIAVGVLVAPVAAAIPALCASSGSSLLETTFARRAELALSARRRRGLPGGHGHDLGQLDRL